MFILRTSTGVRRILFYENYEFNEHPQEPEKLVTQSMTPAAPPSCEGAETAQAELTPPPFDLQSSSPPENQQVSSYSRQQPTCTWS